MRSLLVAATTLMLFATCAAQAKVSITVDKDAQMMTVAVDGVERYHWPVSTGNPTHETPNGTFRTFRMEEDHYSKEFDDAPMPHSIFFTKIGHAIHGTESERNLGVPVSHGCVRLSRANATTLYALVQQQGVLNTTVTLTGSSQVALARNPKGRALARRDLDQQQQQYSDANVGQPTSLAPQAVQSPLFPQARTDDGYIYPADGSSTDQRYPAPRTASRVYNGQAYYYQQQPQQQQYYQQQQPQQSYDSSYGYQQQPQRSYYQQRVYGYPSFPN
jgi:hypothetical protein